jgi:hypothetical protein
MKWKLLHKHQYLKNNLRWTEHTCVFDRPSSRRDQPRSRSRICTRISVKTICVLSSLRSVPSIRPTLRCACLHVVDTRKRGYIKRTNFDWDDSNCIRRSILFLSAHPKVDLVERARSNLWPSSSRSLCLSFTYFLQYVTLFAFLLHMTECRSPSLMHSIV